MTLIELLIIILIVLYVSYVVIEALYAKYLRKHFKYVIHVNGIRGKSTTTRLIDAGLREAGYKVFSKTTGTIPTYINTLNEEKKIFRLIGANIKEQINMMRLAKKEGADILVIECMAVNPTLQELSERLILKSDITIITNVREDHIGEMGESKDDIAKAFASTIPNNGILIINDGEYKNFFIKEAKKKNTTTYVSENYDGDSLDTFNENIAIALELSKALNIDKNIFYNGLKKYHKDYGAYQEFIKDNHTFINALSVNDPQSIEIVYNELTKKYDKNELTILLNSRSDRPIRVKQHIDLLNRIEYKDIILMGSNIGYIKKRLTNKNIIVYKDINTIESKTIVFAIGNIKGKPLKILKYYKEEEALCMD